MPKAFSGFWKTSPPNKHTSSSTGSSVIPAAVPTIVSAMANGHEMVGVVEQVGSRVTSVKPGDRVTVNVETFCGECFFCQHGYVNNCTDVNGG